MRDLKRARVMLDGRSPIEMLEDPVDAMTLTIWCLASRDRPELTFDEAEDMPLGDFDMFTTVGGDDGPPPAASPEPSGKPSGRRGETSDETSTSPKPRSATSSR